MTDATPCAEAVAQLAAGSTRPILASWMGGTTVAEGNACLNQAGIPTYENPGQAVRAFMHLVSYGRNRQILYETPRELPVSFSLDRQSIRERFASTLCEGDTLVSEPLCKSLLSAYGIPTTKTLIARSADEAVCAASEIGYPVVMKIVSPNVSHKTDVGGVMLNLKTDREVRSAFETITAGVARAVVGARIDGVNVQTMIDEPAAVELIVGAKKDATFGAVLLVGMGGTTAELLKDRVLELPPLNERLARRMLEKLHCWPLLTGYRGRPGVDIDRLLEVLIRFSYLVAEFPQIKEFDINPLIASPRRIVALDARGVRDESYSGETARPFEHLAIRPYPEGFERQAVLKNGLQVHLRPIRPEDEGLWHALMATCSFETIRSRFRYLFKAPTHEMASRFCFIDYDREMAIVAELEENGTRKLAGVCRLVREPGYDTAEYAVLVGDPWQGQGLGHQMTEFALEIARVWDLRRVVAMTDRSNNRMLATFRHFGFGLADDADEEVVRATKQIEPKRA
jgi:acetyltransferase